MLRPLAVCLLNISEGRNLNIVEKIAHAACNITSSKDNKQLKCASTVLNIFLDNDYNRSVLTIAASINIAEAVINACHVAYENIDLREHTGGHPRLGAVDLVPIYPISSCVSLDQCGAVAREIGETITTDTPGTSVFLFGSADQPRCRSLVQRRKDVGWYKGKQGIFWDNVDFDLGVSPTPQYGCTGVGAGLYVTNCNVSIETRDVDIGQKIAKLIRATSHNGLPGVQAMAFKHDNCIEIACNVEAYMKQEDIMSQKQCIKYHYTSGEEIKQKIASLASEYQIKTREAIIVGFTPDEVYKMANKALTMGDQMAWKNIKQYRM